MQIWEEWSTRREYGSSMHLALYISSTWLFLSYIFFIINNNTCYSNTGKFKSRRKAYVLVRNCFWPVVTDTIGLQWCEQRKAYFSHNECLVQFLKEVKARSLWFSWHSSHGPKKTAGAPAIIFTFGAAGRGKAEHQNSFQNPTQQLLFVNHWPPCACDGV